MPIRNIAAAGAAFVLISGCTAIPKTDAPRVGTRTPSEPVRSLAGLESVMGRTAQALEAQFGSPSLDVREGSARKLQFSGPVCVLDAYLYPPSGGSDAVVTYVDARLPDGRDIDRASCVAALHQMRQAD